MSETIEIRDEASTFAEDIRSLAEHYIGLFCAHKMMPETTTTISREHVARVLDFDVCDGVDLIYKTLEKRMGACLDNGERLPNDISYVISLYNDCARVGVPKCFATGIIMTYLELNPLAGGVN